LCAHRPFFTIRYKDVDLFADLAAEKPIAAERQGKKIVVEVKSFVIAQLRENKELRGFKAARMD
jgi:hypothetical protein